MKKADGINVQKDDIVTIRIEDISSEGIGIGHVDGYTLFVKDTVMGDVAEVKIIKTKKSFGYGRLIKLIEESSDRVQPVCPIARQCGGCQIQQLSYQKQLEWKQNKIASCLERIGGQNKEHLNEIMEPIIGMQEPYFYRNKAQFPIGRDKQGKAVIGFYAGRTHTIIDSPSCYIQDKTCEVIIEKIKEFLDNNDISVYQEETGNGLVRHVLIRKGFATYNIMVCLVINGEKLPFADKLTESLCEIDGMKSICLNVNTKKSNVILGEEIISIWGNPYIEDSIGGIKYQISPLSFYQVNPKQTKRLYELAMEYAGLTGNETVWDLYCGIGTISLFLAQKAKQVYGVEIVEQAILDAQKNAARNGIENVHFFAGAAEKILPDKYNAADAKMKADIVVLDPPRKGCDQSLLDTIVNIKPEKVIYISCDPGTLARDVKYLSENGYELKRVRGVDQFPQTVHVECVCLLTRTGKQ